MRSDVLLFFSFSEHACLLIALAFLSWHAQVRTKAQFVRTAIYGEDKEYSDSDSDDDGDVNSDGDGDNDGGDDDEQNTDHSFRGGRNGNRGGRGSSGGDGNGARGGRGGRAANARFWSGNAG